MTNNRLRERFEFGKHGYCYYCSAPQVKVPFVFEINDISYKGIGILSNQALIPETILFFRFGYHEEVKEFQVRVKWSKKDGYAYTSGLEFINIVKEDILFLHSIIKKL